MNERCTEGEGACWEGVEMTTSPDQHYTCVHQVPAEVEGKFTCTWKVHH